MGISKTLIICNAYESGIGHGNTRENPHPENTPEHEAYALGMEKGVEMKSCEEVKPVVELTPCPHCGNRIYSGKVESSNLLSIGYNLNKASVRVEFKGGSIYDYFNVPFEVFQDFVNAESAGKFFHKNIKGSYECEKQ